MKLIFMGTPDFCLPILDALKEAGHEIGLVVTMPDAPVGRKQVLSAPPVKKWAIDKGIPVFQPVRIRDEEAVYRLMSCEADIFVVAAYGQILPKAVLELPRFGCVNIHASLLPKYRGAAPIQWAILNGDEKTGITIMQMGEGLDDGDILLQREMAIAPEDTGGSLFDKLAVLGGQSIVEALEKLEAGEIVAVPQDEAKATKVGKIKKELGKLSFEKSAVELERLVRGLAPWPGTYCQFRGKPLKILSVEVRQTPAGEEAACGETIAVSKNEWLVATGEGALSLCRVQPAGKKPMRIEEFLRGYRVAPKERLD